MDTVPKLIKYMDTVPKLIKYMDTVPKLISIQNDGYSAQINLNTKWCIQCPN